MALRILLVALCSAALIFTGMLLYPEGGTLTLGVVRWLSFLPMLAVFYRSFRVGFAKILYVFLLEQSIASSMNLLGHHLAAHFFPGSNLSTGLWQAGASLLCTAVVMPPLWWFFKTSLRGAMAVLSERQTAFFCLSPALFVVLFSLYAGLSQQLSLSPRIDLLFGLLFIFTGVATNFVAIVMALAVADRARLEAKLAASRQQLELQGRHYAEIARGMEDARAARHDVRHHLAAITGFAERHDTEGLLHYLEDYRATLPAEDAGPPVCENQAVDMLTQYYMARAKAAGAALDVKLEVPRQAGIPDSDLSVVFGNLFENAVQSCQRQQAGPRYIRARSEATAGRFVLVVDNSTTDEAPAKSGIGQASVRAVADRYAGTVHFALQKGEYQASVVLQTVPAQEAGIPPGA